MPISKNCFDCNVYVFRRSELEEFLLGISSCKLEKWVGDCTVFLILLSEAADADVVLLSARKEVSLPLPLATVG